MCRLRTIYTNCVTQWILNTHTHTDSLWSFLICNSWNFTELYPMVYEYTRMLACSKTHVQCNTVYSVVLYTTSDKWEHRFISKYSHFTLDTILLFRVIKFMRFNAFSIIDFFNVIFILILLYFDKVKMVAQRIYRFKYCANTERVAEREWQREWDRAEICGEKFGSDWIKNLYCMMILFVLKKEWMDKYRRRYDGLVWLSECLSRWCKFYVVNTIIF